jgi:ABC-2 type transport system permease protein
MRTIWIIAKKELKSFFDSLIAYILLVLFLGFCGFFTWIYGSDVFFVGQATMRPFFSIAYWTLFIFIPAITMRMIAEEKKTGTIELLLTKPITDRQLVLGKFLAALLLICISLAFTLPYSLSISLLGNLDSGELIMGYLGLILMSGVYIAIGLFASSLTNNQIVAFLTALFICLFFHIIFEVLASAFHGWIGEFFNMLSLSSHFESLQRGVLDSKDLIYFLSLIFLGLFLTEANLSKRKING